MTPATTDPPTHEPRQRIRLDGVECRTEANGTITTTVRLEWNGRSVDGSVDGLDTRENHLRLGSEATVKAVSSLVGTDVGVELVGVKATRAFGTWVAMAYLRISFPDGPTRNLLGARALEDEDLTHGGAVAVLDALNRILRPELLR